MNEPTEREHYLRRAAMECACAEAATSDQLRLMHRELAMLYANRAADLELVAASIHSRFAAPFDGEWCQSRR